MLGNWIWQLLTTAFFHKITSYNCNSNCYLLSTGYNCLIHILIFEGLEFVVDDDNHFEMGVVRGQCQQTVETSNSLSNLNNRFEFRGSVDLGNYILEKVSSQCQHHSPKQTPGPLPNSYHSSDKYSTSSIELMTSESEGNFQDYS